jgi:truncated hemoglobin YjbI
LLEVHTYSGSPFPPLKQLPVAKEHFDRWMELFTQTTDSLFTGAAELNFVQRTWQKCLITKLNISETKRKIKRIIPKFGSINLIFLIVTLFLCVN